MKLSPTGMQNLQRREGLRLTAYPDPATGGAPWTIGFGNTTYEDGSKVQKGDTITLERAFVLAYHTMDDIADAINTSVVVPLTQNQFDALASLIYNIGIYAFRNSTLRRKLNSGDYQGAAQEFLRWNRAAGTVNTGLANRRADEMDEFVG